MFVVAYWALPLVQHPFFSWVPGQFSHRLFATLSLYPPWCWLSSDILSFFSFRFEVPARSQIAFSHCLYSWCTFASEFPGEWRYHRLHRSVWKEWRECDLLPHGSCSIHLKLVDKWVPYGSRDWFNGCKCDWSDWAKPLAPTCLYYLDKLLMPSNISHPFVVLIFKQNYLIEKLILLL